MFTNLKYDLLTWYYKAKEARQLSKVRKAYLQARKRSVATLKRMDEGLIGTKKEEIRLFAVMRNEALRLPHFLRYYKNLGVNRFFLIDNGSDDGSVSLALDQKDVHVFVTHETYENHWYWVEHLLDMYGTGHWCVVVDIDELFATPHNISLGRLTQYLDQNQYTALHCLLLDMYADKKITETNYTQNQDPLEVLNYFDSQYEIDSFSFIDRKRMTNGWSKSFVGGMRERVFGRTNPRDILSKIPLFKYDSEMYLTQGMHTVYQAKIADIQGVVFHTKYLFDFAEEVAEEVRREEHYSDAIRYKHYAKTLNQDKNLTFYDREISIEYTSVEQLIELGLMRTTSSFEVFISKKNVD